MPSGAPRTSAVPASASNAYPDWAWPVNRAGGLMQVGVAGAAERRPIAEIRVSHPVLGRQA
ncbi:hypothetical protein FHR32_001482 [Streptosporangium album]|uniref:Uncharacterized protein n=1 Tax=Streptosporangium album TaxID=47479 RepID=A0A7W7RSP5_9ACTN|nr:hypothetical protein [Streptosporangium album]